MEDRSQLLFEKRKKAIKRDIKQKATHAIQQYLPLCPILQQAVQPKTASYSPTRQTFVSFPAAVPAKCGCCNLYRCSSPEARKEKGCTWMTLSFLPFLYWRKQGALPTRMPDRSCCAYVISWGVGKGLNYMRMGHTGREVPLCSVTSTMKSQLLSKIRSPVEQKFLNGSSLPFHITLTPCLKGQNTFDISTLEN